MHHLPPTLLLSLLLLLAQLSGRAGSAPIDQRAINAAHANVRLVCLVRAGIASSAAQRAGTLKVLAPVHLAQLVSSYTDTPAMRQLAGGYIGKRRHALAKDLHKSVQAAAEKMLRLCAEEGGLVPLFQSSGQWAVPPAPQLPGCGSKRLHVVVVTSDSIKPGFSMSQHMLGSFRMRGLPLPATLLSRGHNVSWYSARDHAALFDGCLLDPNFRFPFPFGPSADGSTVLALVVKQRPERFMQCFAKHGVPVVLDLIDNTIEYSKYRDYRLILATSRVAALMFERNTGVRALPLYHQPPNYARFHRADRSAPVRSVSMTHQRVNHGLETDELAALIGRYCTLRNITFRLGEYSGHGFDQQELREYLTAPHDWGSQMGYAMGYSSVDIGVVWLPCAVPEMLCVKPTTRVVGYMSMGIPTVFIGAAAYLDVVVMSGYPLVATSVTHALELLDLLVGDPELRQATSELGLQIAERFHLDSIANDFERALCSV